MSLTTNEKLYAGYEQADCAALVANGIPYRCFVYLSRVTWAVEALCVRVQPDGTWVQIFHNIIARASAQEIVETNGVPLDCPKVIACGTTFVAHWLQCTDIVGDTPPRRNWQLYRATMDMESFSVTSWDDRGAVALLYSHLLYDVAPVIGHPTDFVVARVTDDDEITVQRFEAFDWIDQTWQEQSVSDEPLLPTILGVYAHESDDDLVLSYQREDFTARDCYSRRYDAADGGNESLEVVTFPDFAAAAGGESGVGNFVQIGHCRVASRRVAVVTEVQAYSNQARGEPYSWIHHVAYRAISTADAGTFGNEHWAAHLSMLSRPWTYANGTAGVGSSPDVYCILGNRSIVDGQEWSQSYAYACNLDYAQWQQVPSGAGLRPRPISTYHMLGVPDVRTSGWHPQDGDVHIGGPTKRMNQISYACDATPSGIDVKTRTAAMISFAAIGSQRDNQPGVGGPTPIQTVGVERAALGFMKVFMEDPWQLYRDSSDAEQPVANFNFAYSRAMHQAVPAGKGLFIGGGAPGYYDGRQVVESGFPWKPEIIDHTQAESANGDTETNDLGLNGVAGTGTYSWYVVYSWTDSAGQMHRSAPSNVLTVELTDSNSIVLFSVRTLSISLKDATAFYPLTPAINIEVYRTAANGTQFFRVYGATDVESSGHSYRPRDTPINNPESMAGTVTIIDGLGDDSLILQGLGPYQLNADGVFSEPLPIVLPAMSVVANFQNRIWGASSIDPRLILYSDEISPDVGSAFYSAPVFANGQIFAIGEIGEITLMHGMDGALIVMTANSIHALTASDAGFGLLNVASQVLHEDVGCVDPRTAVLYAHGIGFQSQRGYFLLSRSRETGYYSLARSRDDAYSTGGAAVEDDLREAGNVRAASLIEDRAQIRLVCNGEPVVTQTWTFTLGVAGSTAGAWTISGLSQPISVTIGVAVAVNTIADNLAAAIQALVIADAPDTLRFEVSSVTSPGNTVVVELLGDVDLTLTGDAPGSCTNVASLEEEIETRPWVEIYDTILQQWSRAELPQTNAETRLSELVGGCTWRGDGGSCHVALAQGSILIERQPGTSLTFADQTSTGIVGIPLDLTFSWWHLAGISGAQRLYEAAIQTERYTSARVHVDLEADNDGSYDGRQLPMTTYEWPRIGDATTPADLRVKPRFQRARAHRLRLYEDVGVTTEETMAVVAVTLTAGVEPGTKRVSGAQRGEV